MRFLGAEKPQHPSAEYYPNSVGSLLPGNAGTYAFLVLGKDDRAIQVQVLSALYRHGARVLSQTGYVDDRTREFTLCVNCDLTNANITPDDIVIELRRMKPVNNVLSVCLKDKIFDGFLFPMTFMNANRVVVVNSSLTFQIQERLNSEEERLLLRDLGRDLALDVVKQVKERLGPGRQANTIQENVRGYFRAAGWGMFVWQTEAAFERMTVTDPPTSSKGEAVGNFFLQGMASGFVEAFRNHTFTVAEEVYNRETRSLTIMLSEPKIESKGRQKVPKSVEIKALEEVEKVIRSVQQDEEENQIITVAPSKVARKTEEEAEEDELVEEVELSRPPLIQVVAGSPKEQKQQLVKEITRRREEFEKDKRPVAPVHVKKIRIEEQRPHVEISEDDEDEKEIQETDESVKRPRIEKLSDLEDDETGKATEESEEEADEESEPAEMEERPKKPIKLQDEDDDDAEGDSMWFDPVVLE